MLGDSFNHGGKLFDERSSSMKTSDIIKTSTTFVRGKFKYKDGMLLKTGSNMKRSSLCSVALFGKFKAQLVFLFCCIIW